MNKEVIWIIGFLLGICILSAKKKIGQVYLEVIDQPIVFGESVQLFCNLSLVPDCCSNTVTWMKNLDVIVHHGTSFDASKYAQIPAQTGFSLQINHFAETDLYAKFWCLYGFDEDRIVIGMEKNKYERHPSSDEIRINEHLDEKNNVFEIDILFERVLPMPSCILLSNDQDLKAQNVTKQHSIGMFYNVSIQLKLNNSLDDCPNNITLKCSIGGYNMSHTVKNGSFCSDIPNVHSDQKNDAKVIIIILLLTVFLSFVVFGSVKFKRVYLSNKGQQQDEELESIALLGTCEPVHVPNNERKAPSRTVHVPNNERKAPSRTDSLVPMQKDRHVRECLKLKKKKSNLVHLIEKGTEDQYRTDDNLPIQNNNYFKKVLNDFTRMTKKLQLRVSNYFTACPDERLDSIALSETSEPVHLLQKEREARYRTDDNLPIQKNKDLKKVIENCWIFKYERQEIIPSWKKHEPEHLRKRKQAEYRTDENLPVQKIEEVHKWKKSHKYN